MRCRREVPAWPVEVAAGGPGTHAAGPGQRGPTGDRVEFPRTRSSGGRDDLVTTRALARRWAELAIWLFPLCQGPRHSGISIAVFGSAPSARAPSRVSWFGRTHGWHITCEVGAARRPAAIRATEVAERRSAQCYRGRAQTRGRHHRARTVHFLPRPSHGPSRSRRPSRSCTGTSSRRDDLFTVGRRRPATIAA